MFKYDFTTETLRAQRKHIRVPKENPKPSFPGLTGESSQLDIPQPFPVYYTDMLYPVAYHKTKHFYRLVLIQKLASLEN